MGKTPEFPPLLIAQTSPVSAERKHSPKTAEYFGLSMTAGQCRESMTVRPAVHRHHIAAEIG